MQVVICIRLQPLTAEKRLSPNKKVSFYFKRAKLSANVRSYKASWRSCRIGEEPTVTRCWSNYTIIANIVSKVCNTRTSIFRLVTLLMEQR